MTQTPLISNPHLPSKIIYIMQSYLFLSVSVFRLLTLCKFDLQDTPHLVYTHVLCCSTLNSCSNDFICRHFEHVMPCKQGHPFWSQCEDGIVGEGRVVGVQKFHSQAWIYTQIWDQVFLLPICIIIGASLREPHTNVTTLQDACVCMCVCLCTQGHIPNI